MVRTSYRYITAAGFLVHSRRNSIGTDGQTDRQNHKLSSSLLCKASIAQLGERKTEDLKAPCSIHGRSIMFCLFS